MTIQRAQRFGWGLAIAVLLGTAACTRTPEAGTVKDEALLAGRNADSFHAAGEDYFHDMDGGRQLQAAEIQGRNTWIVWTGGNDRFWDSISRNSVGALDFLKTLSSYPGKN